MRRPRRMPAKQPILSAASLCVVAVLPGCSAVPSSADPPVPATTHSAVPSAVPSTVHSTKTLVEIIEAAQEFFDKVCTYGASRTRTTSASSLLTSARG